MMNGRRSTARHANETEELAFRYQSLLAAQRILDEQQEPSKGNTKLRNARLRRLRLYVQNSIAAVEQRMEQLGLTLAQPDIAEDSTQNFSEPLGAAVSDH